MSFKERLTLFLKSETETEPELKRCPHPSELRYLVPSELGYYRHNQVISMVNQLDYIRASCRLACCDDYITLSAELGQGSESRVIR